MFMRIIHCVIFCLLLVGGPSVTRAQESNPPPPPPPAKDYFPNLWKEFASSDGKFKILLPGLPKESIRSEESSNGKVFLHVVTYKSFISYSVMYVDHAQAIDDPATVKQFLANARDNGLSAVTQAHPRVVRDSEIEVSGHPGRFLHVELLDRAVLRVRWIVVGNRLYVVSATTPKGRPNVMGAENDYEKIAFNFLDSFQLVGSGGKT
jgi:hypothetical protein